MLTPSPAHTCSLASPSQETGKGFQTPDLQSPVLLAGHRRSQKQAKKSEEEEEEEEEQRPKTECVAQEECRLSRGWDAGGQGGGRGLVLQVNKKRADGSGLSLLVSDLETWGQMLLQELISRRAAQALSPLTLLLL